MNADGLIYTDPTFLDEVKRALKARGYSGTAAIEYSEQGLQGPRYVDFDVDQDFVENI